MHSLRVAKSHTPHSKVPARDSTNIDAMDAHPSPLILQSLYVHAPDEAYFYPSARSHASAARVAWRYLECAVAQAASLRLRATDCDLALVTHIQERGAPGRPGAPLLERLDALGVQVLHADSRRRPADDSKMFMS